MILHPQSIASKYQINNCPKRNPRLFRCLHPGVLRHGRQYSGGSFRYMNPCMDHRITGGTYLQLRKYTWNCKSTQNSSVPFPKVTCTGSATNRSHNGQEDPFCVRAWQKPPRTQWASQCRKKVDKWPHRRHTGLHCHLGSTLRTWPERMHSKGSRLTASLVCEALQL